ncbi:MAG: DUF3089 domain-containing protein [Lachnospiraceae bacterium]|nr:DUF3089 domain-containing protein [Lachnospiraceae bacterium]
MRKKKLIAAILTCFIGTSVISPAVGAAGLGFASGAGLDDKSALEEEAGTGVDESALEEEAGTELDDESLREIPDRKSSQKGDSKDEIYFKSVEEVGDLEETGDAISLPSGVSADMCKAAYWADKAKGSKIDADKTLISMDGIEKLNQEMLNAEGTNMNDLEALSETYDAAALRDTLSKNAPWLSRDLYIDTVKVSDNKAFFEAIGRDIVETGYSEKKEKNQYAVAVKRTDILVVPIKGYVGYSATDGDNENVNSALNVNEPFVIRQKVSVSGNEFYWGYSINCSGWVAAEDLAVCADKAEWLDAWKVDPSSKDFLVITQNNITLEPSYYNEYLSKVKLTFATVLKLVPEEDKPDMVGERGNWYNYVVYLPTRDENGKYVKRPALISQHYDVSEGFLEMTQREILRVAFNSLGDRYGWGGMLDSMDCSLYTRNVCKCFGLEIPRNTNWQELIPGRAIDLSSLSEEEKLVSINKLPAGTLLYFQGHTMIYTGTDQGMAYVISDTGSLSDSEGEVNVRTMYSVILNPLSVRRRNGNTWLKEIDTAVLPFSEECFDLVQKNLSGTGTVSGGDVDSLLSQMSLKRKVEQMLMPNFRYVTGEDGKEAMSALTSEAKEVLSEHNFGGVILYSENAKTAKGTAEFVNDLQEANGQALVDQIPLFISIDQEGGRVTRLGTGTSLPGNMALGATVSKGDAVSAGEIIGEELSSLGINMDFAPVMDVNDNPANPIIGVRSFSSDPEKVAEIGPGLIEGLQSKNVMTALKHFPGHGNTDTDSHTGLPLIDRTLAELEECELIPFKAGIDAGTDMIMTAHIEYPEIETEKATSIKTGEEITLPATLSKTIITDILREKMGFEGVVVTDALEMDAIREHFTSENAAKKAINADCDILLVPFDTSSKEALAEADKYIDMICDLVKSGEIAEEEIDDSVKRILELKKKYGILDEVETVDPEEAVKVVGSKENHDKEWEIASRAMTLVKNDSAALPLSVSKDSVMIFVSQEGEAAGVKYAIDRLKSEGKIPENAEIPIEVYSNKSIEDFSERLVSVNSVLAISNMTNVKWLNPADPTNGAQALFLDNLIAAMHEKKGKISIISSQLPYDAARLVSADSVLLAYCNKQMTEAPDWEREENPTYGVNVPVAVYTAFGGVNPSGKLPVDIPKISSGYGFEDEVLYEIGTGLNYGEDADADPEDWEALDYSLSQNWISYDDEESMKKADVFWLCPSISDNSTGNLVNGEYQRQLFRNEFKSESGIYIESGRMFAPFYREMGLNSYLDKNKDIYLANAYKDVAASFEYYLAHENNNRPIILAGYSQGADMCYRLLQDFFGDENARSKALRERLVAVYGLGWAMTDEMVEKYPQIVPATGETDTGVVVSFECEDDRMPTISGNMIIPEGTRMIAINPLSWKADNNKADKSLNKGSVIVNKDQSKTISPNYCGAYIDPVRGCLKVTDLTGTYRILNALGEGSLHLYDYMLFYSNLKANVADRLEAYLNKEDQAADDENEDSSGKNEPEKVTPSSNKTASANASVSLNKVLSANTISINKTYTSSDGKIVKYPEKLPFVGANWAKYLKETSGIIYVSGNSSPIKSIKVKMKAGKTGTAEIRKIVFENGDTLKKPGIKIEIVPYEITNNNAAAVLDFSKKNENTKKNQVKGLKVNFTDLKSAEGTLVSAKLKKISPKATSIITENRVKKIKFNSPFSGTISANIIGL